MWWDRSTISPLEGNLEDLQLKALQNRPDLRAAQQGVTAANSQYELQGAIAKQDSTVQANYSHVNRINTATFYWSMPPPFDAPPGREMCDFCSARDERMAR